MAILSEEQAMLRDAAARWTRARSPVESLRQVRNARSALGYDAQIWAEMAGMGWAGVIVPESYGGADLGYAAIGLVLEETGRTLTASPLLDSGLTAAAALVLGGSATQKAHWLPKIVGGEAVATLAVDETVRHAPQAVTLRADPVGAGYKLTGTKRHVPEGAAADLLIVSARTSGGPGDRHGITLMLVPATAAGLERAGLSRSDSRGSATLTFDDVIVPANAVLGALDEGYDLLEQILDRARAGLAAEMLGAASEAFRITIDYLKTRVQFGKVIGSFQALQHRAAQMFTELELTRSVVEAALAAFDAGSPEAAQLASLAKCKAGETFRLVSNEMVQMHGGIGMTDDHVAGFYLKRARAAETMYGNAAFHRDRYARLQGY